jgi:hypothetical protein
VQTVEDEHEVQLLMNFMHYRHVTDPAIEMESSANPGWQEMHVFSPEQSVQFGWMSEHGWHIEVDELR